MRTVTPLQLRDHAVQKGGMMKKIYMDQSERGQEGGECELERETKKTTNIYI